MKIFQKLLVVISFLFMMNVSFAHPGGLDKQGGHKDAKTGEYHCHTDECKNLKDKKKTKKEEGKKTKKKKD
jgi:hypothetical protein